MVGYCSSVCDTGLESRRSQKKALVTVVFQPCLIQWHLKSNLLLLSGVTVTIDVRHSRVMKRQYLNILYSPTAAYKGHTEGLCGFMDNNATNDFMGTDGNLYDDAIQFAESCKQSLSHSLIQMLPQYFKLKHLLVMKISLKYNKILR